MSKRSIVPIIPTNPALRDAARGDEGPHSTLEGADPDAVPGALGYVLETVDRLEAEAAEAPPGDPPKSTIKRPRRALPKG